MMMILVIYGLKYWHNTGVKEFIFAMLASSWWVLCQAFELMAVTLPVKTFWANIEYIGLGCSLAYLMQAMSYAGYKRFLRKKVFLFLMPIFCIFWILFITDQYHGLMRTNFSLDTSAIPYTIKKDYGILYPAYLVFMYMVTISTIVILFFTVKKRDSLYQKQAKLLLVFLFLIIIPNALYYLKLLPIGRFDLSPAFFSVGALVMSWGIYHNKFLNIMPIARDMLIETMESGVVVTNKNNRIIDINQSATLIFSLGDTMMIGRDISEIKAFSDRISMEGTWPKEFYYHKDNKIYDIKMYPVNDEQKIKVGYLFTINDITEQKETTQKIIEQEKVLTIMGERERMGRELHDGFGQEFGYINAQAQTVREYIGQGKEDEAVKHLETLISATRDAHSNVRDHILEMRGVSQRNRSFSAILKQYARQFSEKNDIAVKIIFADGLPSSFPESESAVELLKIIQEALTNIRKHAGTCQAEISFQEEGDNVVVCIEDDGDGFDLGQQREGHHYGLSIMQERAAEMGTQLQIFSQIGKGTKIILRLPKGGKK